MTKNYKEIMNVYDRLLEVSKRSNFSIVVSDYNNKGYMAYAIKYEYCNKKYEDSIIINEEFEDFEEGQILEDIEDIIKMIEKIKS